MSPELQRMEPGKKVPKTRQKKKEKIGWQKMMRELDTRIKK